MEFSGLSHWGDRIIGVLKGEGSWQGVVNDFLGLTGYNSSHENIAHHLGHQGVLRGLTFREVQAVLVRIGVPVKELAETLENLEII